MAAMRGRGWPSITTNSSCSTSASWSPSPLSYSRWRALRSPPAQNARSPSPPSTRTRIAGSPYARRMHSVSWMIVSRLSVLSASGRLSVATPTWPSTRHLISSSVILVPLCRSAVEDRAALRYDAAGQVSRGFINGEFPVGKDVDGMLAQVVSCQRLWRGRMCPELRRVSQGRYVAGCRVLNSPERFGLLQLLRTQPAVVFEYWSAHHVRGLQNRNPFRC